MVPRTGIEPVRSYTNRRILSPVRLPVPPPRHYINYWSERRDLNPRPSPWQGGVLPLNYVRIDLLFYIKKCRLHDLNTRPSDYKSDALPTELSRLLSIMRVKGVEPPRREALDPKSSASANSAKPANMNGEP